MKKLCLPQLKKKKRLAKQIRQYLVPPSGNSHWEGGGQELQEGLKRVHQKEAGAGELDI